MIYGADSFFTLGPLQGVGLVMLSLALWALCLWAVWHARLRVWPRLGLALALFWAFVWLSPQVYYGYYLLIFDGLPIQSVLKAPPGPWRLARLLSFTEEASLSRHGQGVLGWSLLGVAAWFGRAHSYGSRSPGSGDRS